MMLSYISTCCFTFAALVTLGATQSTTKTIPLNKALTYINKELYGDFVYLNKSSSLQVNFSEVGTNLSFIIFQVHSHLYNVMLKSLDTNYNVSGTNIGLYSSVNKLDTFYISNPHQNVDLKLFVTVLGYLKLDPIPGGCNTERFANTMPGGCNTEKFSDPIPGGCNMEFSVPISPFMRAVLHNKTYVDIEASPAQDQNNDPGCTNPYKTLQNMSFYMLYLPEHDYSADVYFETIRKMTTVENIRKFEAHSIPESAEQYWATRRRISAYPGSGAIFVAIAGIESNYSVYVPTHSYGCSPLLDNDCELLEDPLTMFMSVVLFFIGISMCYFGHWFFKTQIVTLGFLSGFVVTYIIVALVFDIDNSGLVKAAVLSGLCLGALRLVCWWLYGIPAYIIVLSSADVGFLIASILYYMSPGGENLQSNLTFWNLFILVILVTTICLLWMSHVASMICSSMIGGYTAIYPLDYYMGSNLKYIINNTVRRATVPDFNKAIIYPPCQWRDIFLIVIWTLLAVSGFLYQFYYNNGRPPFPPPPRSVRAIPEGPTEPRLRRRSSVAIFWAMWVQRCRQRRSSSFMRNVNERSPLLEEIEE